MKKEIHQIHDSPRLTTDRCGCEHIEVFFSVVWTFLFHVFYMVLLVVFLGSCIIILLFLSCVVLFSVIILSNVHLVSWQLVLLMTLLICNILFLVLYYRLQCNYPFLHDVLISITC